LIAKKIHTFMSICDVQCVMYNICKTSPML